MKRKCRDIQSKRFLKTLTGDFSRKLKLPEKLSTYLKDNEIQTVDLKGPGGDKWKVSLKERKGILCLRDGWCEFVHSHHLAENDTLHFEYEVESSYNVLIFDESGCEKVSTYCAKNKCSAKGKCSVMEGEDTSRPGAPQSRPSRANENEKGETSSRNREGTIILFPKPEPDETSELEDGEKVERSSKRTKKCVKFPRSTLVQSTPPPSCSDEKKAKALELAKAFKPEKPSFMMVMKKSTVPPTGYNAPVNTEFCRKHLSESSGSMMRLQIPGKKEEWKVSFRMYKQSYYFVARWIKFARDNSLQIGDVLVFELVSENAFDVHIFRASHD